MSHTQTVASTTTMEDGQPVLLGQQPAAPLAAAAGVQQPQQPNLVLGQSETALELFRSDSSPGNGGVNGHSPQTPRAQQGAAEAGRDEAEHKADVPPAAQVAVEGEAAAAAAAGQQQPAPSADSAAAQQQPPPQQPAANQGANEAQEQAYRAAQQQMAAYAAMVAVDAAAAAAAAAGECVAAAVRCLRADSAAHGGRAGRADSSAHARAAASAAHPSAFDRGLFGRTHAGAAVESELGSWRAGGRDPHGARLAAADVPFHRSIAHANRR